MGVASVLLLIVAGCAHREAAKAPVEPIIVPTSYVLAADTAAIGAAAVYATRPNETLLDVARRYDLGFTQLMTANPGLDPWNPGVEKQIALPAFYLLPDGPRRGIVISLKQQRLFYFPAGGASVETFPIGVGVQGRATPLGTTRIVRKAAHPVWHVPASIRAEDPDLPNVVGPGPDNPLGDYAFSLGWPSYLIHATNQPYGIGRNVSHGCIQLYPEDMARLFDEVPVGTPVRVVDRDIETAWVGDDLYVAVFPTKNQSEAIGINKPVVAEIPDSLRQQVKKAAGGRSARIDWRTVDAAGHDRTGIPVRVTLPALASN